MKPAANTKARETRGKLEALAERGIDGEKLSAEKKLARFIARYDWTLPNPDDAKTQDLFAGTFARLPGATGLLPFNQSEMDIGFFVLWAIRDTTKIPCAFRDGILVAETGGKTGSKLADIALTIKTNLEKLWEQYAATPGANAADRGNFLLGLYEGMLNEIRSNEALPRRIIHKTKAARARKNSVAIAPGLTFHPYTVAVNLGKQIRLCAPLESITQELDRTIKGELNNANA